MSKNEYNLSSFYNQLTKNTALLYKYQFVVEFIQGGQNYWFQNDPSMPDQNFSYYCQSGKIPNFKINKAKVAYYGTDFRVPTVMTFDHSWDCKIILQQDMIMFDKLKAWMKHISDIRNNGGGTKQIPNVDLRLNLLDSTHQYFTTSFVMVGVWPTSMSDIKLSYKERR